jgi:hypothetical protein
MRIIDEIQGCPIYELSDGTVFFVADADIDCDGSGGNPEHDPYFQDDTFYHDDGKALNAYDVPFVVVPPSVVLQTRKIVMGCAAIVTNLMTGEHVNCVVGDLGPMRKIGEISVAAARAISVNPNPKVGGEENRIIAYEIRPGLPAYKSTGSFYALQSYRGNRGMMA